jgi:hypothetical protein
MRGSDGLLDRARAGDPLRPCLCGDGCLGAKPDRSMRPKPTSLIPHTAMPLIACFAAQGSHPGGVGHLAVQPQLFVGPASDQLDNGHAGGF